VNRIFIIFLIAFLILSLGGVARAADLGIDPGNKKKCEKLKFKPDVGKFGDVEIGDSKPLTVTVTNPSTNTEAIDISAIDVTPASFSIDTVNTTCGGPLAPGASCDVVVKFTPTKVGEKTGTVKFIIDGCPDQTSTVTGTGIKKKATPTATATATATATSSTSPTPTATATSTPAGCPTLFFEPDPVSFGEVEIGQTKTKSLEATNFSEKHVADMVLVEAPEPPFAIVPGINHACPKILSHATGNTCFVELTCTPTGVGKKTDEVHFIFDGCPEQTVKVSCTGIGGTKPTPTATATRTATATETPTRTPTSTATATASRSATPTLSATATRTATTTITPRATPTATFTATATVTSTSTVVTPTATATATAGTGLWVTSGGIGPPDVNQVTVYPLPIGSNPNISPAVTITGQFNSLCTSLDTPFPCCTGSGTGTCVDNTMLDIPSGIAVDASGNLYVANEDNPSALCSDVGTPLSCCTGPSAGTCGNSQCTAAFTPFTCCIGSGTGICFGNSINVFAAGSNGNATPTRTISGGNTQLLLAADLKLVGSSIFTANRAKSASAAGTGSVLSFPESGSGNLAPSVSIFTPNTLGAIPTFILAPTGVAVDSAGDIYVVNGDGPWITIYPPGSNGDVCPTGYSVGGGSDECLSGFPNGILGCGAPGGGICSGPDITQLGLPYGIALDSAGNIYVTNDGGPPGAPGASVTIYAAGSTGNVAPLETIAGQSNDLCSGPATPFACCSGTAGDPNSSCTASGMPLSCCSGADAGSCTNSCVDNTGLDFPEGIALDSKGNIYVANFGNFTITEYSAFGGTSVGTLNEAPIATINTGLVGNSPSGIAIGPFTP
jgi:Abnormal spindle-like microcephaly-assoc'd, ASPM-SPD-2-Hydin/NHL repeat